MITAKKARSNNEDRSRQVVINEEDFISSVISEQSMTTNETFIIIDIKYVVNYNKLIDNGFGVEPKKVGTYKVSWGL